jgi:hypothetical protein
MASIIKRLQQFAASPKGKELQQRLKEQASKPENQRKLQDLQRRLKEQASKPENQRKLRDLQRRLKRR